MGRLRKETVDHDFPDLPQDFVERVRRKGRRTMSLTELVEDFKEWRKRKGVN